MNLADAIRKALNESPKPPEGFARVEPREHASETDHEEFTARPLVHADEAKAPAENMAAGNFARLELFLSPEQIANVLKVAFIYHRSVMSLREAANYLRCSSRALEELAEQGEIPAFMIDGLWRFPKTAIDEWFAIRAATEQENRKHAA